jgi:hypothetical protein
MGVGSQSTAVQTPWAVLEWTMDPSAARDTVEDAPGEMVAITHGVGGWLLGPSGV